MSKRVTDLFDFGSGWDYFSPPSTCSVIGEDAMMMGGGAAAAAFTVDQSIRFNDDDSAYMHRTPSVAGNRKTWTWSGWVKRSKLTAFQNMFAADDGTANERSHIAFDDSDRLSLYMATASATNAAFATNARNRDASAYYHCVIAVDTTQATAGNRVKMWINGVAQTFATEISPDQNADYQINNTVIHSLSKRDYSTDRYFDGYLADVHFIDGAALTAASFGETDAFGNWVPIAYAGTDATLDYISTAGTNIGDMTLRGGLAAAFDGTIEIATAACGSLAAAGVDAFVGKDWGSGVTKTVTAYGLTSPSDEGFTNTDPGTSTNFTVTLQGSTDNFSASIVDLHTDTFSDTSSTTAYGKFYASGITTTTAYRYHRLKVSYATGSNWITVAELQFFVAGTGYGTNGFYITGANSAALGTDYSGNSNTYTTSGLTTADQMLDTPVDDIAGTGASNYCTWSPIGPAMTSKGTFADGNLNWTTGAVSSVFGTIAVSSGQHYWEVSDGTNVIGMALDMDALTCSWYKNNAIQHTSVAIASGTYTPALCCNTSRLGIGIHKIGTINSYATELWNQTAIGSYLYWSNDGIIYKSGQANSSAAATFANVSVSTANFGQSAFTYTPPTGFKALCTGNLPAPAITVPTDYFNTKIFTGTGAENALTFGGINAMQPDFVWIKDRDTTVEHLLVDAVRGATKELNSDSTLAETTVAQGLKSFDADGFTLGTDGNYNTSSSLNVAWAWKANGAGASNTDGTITATVSAETTAGFSISTYTGSGTAATIGHGLTSAPDLVMVKKRTNDAQSWYVYHSGDTAAPETDYLLLDTTAATADLNTIWNDTAPTTSVFSIGTHTGVNDSGGTDTYVAYCQHSVEGFSKFGSYTGNGSVDGPFVHCGFRPAFVMVKCSSATGSWHMFDDLRAGYNVDNNAIMADTTAAEVTTDLVDMTSNGFKLRIATAPNTAATYIYAAFAEHPFGGDGVSQARAR